MICENFSFIKIKLWKLIIRWFIVPYEIQRSGIFCAICPERFQDLKNFISPCSHCPSQNRFSKKRQFSKHFYIIMIFVYWHEYTIILKIHSVTPIYFFMGFPNMENIPVLKYKTDPRVYLNYEKYLLTIWVFI